MLFASMSDSRSTGGDIDRLKQATLTIGVIMALVLELIFRQARMRVAHRVLLRGTVATKATCSPHLPTSRGDVYRSDSR